MIPCQRHLFDIPEDVAYFNCGYMAPMMHSVAAAGVAAVQRKLHPWEVTPAHFFDDVEIARALFAELIGATADDIALVPAASYGIAIAAANLAPTRDQSIIVLDEQFPSNVYSWRELAGDTGARLITVQRPADDDWTTALVEAIGTDTAIVACGNIHWTDGSLIDLYAVAERCHEVGAALVLDITQSAGVVPIDVGRLEPAFLVSAAYKSLLGPYSLGFCYVAPQHQGGRPLEHNWIAQRGSEDFTSLVNYRDEFQPGARRFDFGERGNFSLVQMAIPALRQILAWGVSEIEATLRHRTNRIAERAAELGIGAVPADRRSGYCLGLRFSDGVPSGLAERLGAERVYVSLRGSTAIRLTPHLWVNDADEDRLLQALRSAIS